MGNNIRDLQKVSLNNLVVTTMENNWSWWRRRCTRCHARRMHHDMPAWRSGTVLYRLSILVKDVDQIGCQTMDYCVEAMVQVQIYATPLSARTMIEINHVYSIRTKKFTDVWGQKKWDPHVIGLPNWKKYPMENKLSFHTRCSMSDVAVSNMQRCILGWQLVYQRTKITPWSVVIPNSQCTLSGQFTLIRLLRQP
jgi:hypothetical protein